jgi:hypothetical protein
MIFRIGFDPFEQCSDFREFAFNRKFILCDFRDAAPLFIKIAAQILLSIIVATVKTDHRRQLAAEVYDTFFDGTEMHRFFGSDTKERAADIVIGDSRGLLAKAHHMLFLSDVAMTQHIEGDIARALRAVIQSSVQC